MDSRRSVDIDRLRRDIEATRASISRTAGELRWKAGEAMQWQTYVERYPGPVLAAAALVGIVVGRRIAHGLNATAYRGSERQWTSAAAGMDSVTRIPARIEAGIEAGIDRLAAASASWQRLASRVEGLVNRVIDDVADSAEGALVPALVGGVQAFLERRAARPPYRSTPPDGTSASQPAEGR